MALTLAPGRTLFFCRHGETVANVEKRFQGRSLDTPLTANGREQARAIAAILRAACPAFAALDFVCSPLPRAGTTLQIIRGELGLAPGAFRTDDRLMEINLGLWDGLTDREASARYPLQYEARNKDKWNVRVPGGEDYADVAARAESWIADLRGDTFAVSHGAFTRVLRGLFQGLDWKQMSDLDETQGVAFRVRGSVVTRLDGQ